jgi:hypothetical protein
MTIGAVLRGGAGAFALLLLAHARPLGAQEDTGAFLQSARANVVRVVVGSNTGFGFIVGLGERSLLIATAEHTLEGTDGPPLVCFLETPGPCAEGTAYPDDPRAAGDLDLDLALIDVPYPERLAWRPDVMGRVPAAGEPAWFIGRNETWFIPAAPGRIVASDPARGDLTYTALPVAAGVSGAPILVPSGIVAMHRESSGDDEGSRGILLSLIRNRVEERLGRQWILVPRATCGRDAASSVLANRWVVVRFPWHRAAAALDAMARLRCLGALTLPAPRWERTEGQREIVYRSGDLRSARYLQSVLAPLGRIETRSGEPEGAELEIILP